MEGASRELSGLVRREREEKAAKEKREREREERATAAEARRGSTAGEDGKTDGTAAEAKAAAVAEPALDGEGGGLTASMVEEGVNLSASVTGSTPLNPTAAPFEPPALKSSLNTTGNDTDTSSASDASPASPTAVDGAAPNAATPPPQDATAPESAGSPNGAMSASLSKSWAQVVVQGSGEATEATAPAAKEEVVASGAAVAKTNGEAAAAVADEPTPAAGPSKAVLWQQIKILCTFLPLCAAVCVPRLTLLFSWPCAAFTRTLTTLYLISLLTLQTHVQLSLLGRASYVAAVIAGLPTTDSPASSQLDLLNASAEDDLEMANLAQEIDLAQKEGGQAEVERLYLSVSWWLLHEGARQVGDKVKAAVEDVVGP